MCKEVYVSCVCKPIPSLHIYICWELESASTIDNGTAVIGHDGYRYAKGKAVVV